ncbi:MAG: DUF4139 domain-containing protein [Oscillatoria sp. SIO1A7]|nr:DUF4139 domain-containing protein [Oscillatoria sp. SIO1A7]
MIQLTAKIDKVKVYASGATIVRAAEVERFLQSSQEVEIPGLPLALDDSSVRVRVEAEAGTAALATDVRIGLAVPPRTGNLPSPTDEEVRAAAAEVRGLEDTIALINNEINSLYRLEVPDRPDGERGKAPPPSPTSTRLALNNFKDEQVRVRLQERRETQEKLRQARERLVDLQEKQARASTAKDARPHELRKTAVIRLSYNGENSGEQSNNKIRLVLEYFVPGARWTPTYVCRLDSVANSAAIAVRALICQQTGEDWSGVQLELSTALPMQKCELPELASLRIGRPQPIPRKSGWRRPPAGAQLLFEDFDRQKKAALSAARQPETINQLPKTQVAPLPEPIPIAPGAAAGASVTIGVVDDGVTIGVVDDEAELERRELVASFNFEADEEELAEDTLYNEVDIAKSLRSKGYAELRTEESQSLEKVTMRSAVPPAAPIPGGQVRRRARKKETSGFAALSAKMEAPVAAATAAEEAEGLAYGDTAPDIFAYGQMQMGAASDPDKRGKLSLVGQQEAYLEILKRQELVIRFNITEVLQQAVSKARNSLNLALPPGGINVRNAAGSFDYAYSADGRIDVPSDGQFHSVALTSNSTEVQVRYVVVPREDSNVFRIAQLRNPLSAPLLSGPADVYVDGEYILSTNIDTVPPKAEMELGLGVEQAIKVARNTFYQEARSGETIVAFNELRHQVKIEIANNLPRSSRIEVRDRLPVPEEGAKVDVQIDRVVPDWEKYEQQERGTPIKGGYRWQDIEVPAGSQTTLEVDYTIKTFVDSELIGGNRR